MGSGIGWSGGQYTIKKRATPIEAAHKAARRVWREANKKRIEKPYFNFIMREIGTHRTSSYRAYKEKLSSPKTFIRGGKTIVSNYDYFAKPCGASEFQAPKQSGGGDVELAADLNEYFEQMGGFGEDTDISAYTENDDSETEDEHAEDEHAEDEPAEDKTTEDGTGDEVTGAKDTEEATGGGRRYMGGRQQRRR